MLFGVSRFHRNTYRNSKKIPPISIGMEYHTTHHPDYNIETTGGKGVYLLYIVNTVSREGGVFNILSSKIINILKLFSM